MSPNRIEGAEDPEEIVAMQNASIKALTERVRGMDARIKVSTDLVDKHHASLRRARTQSRQVKSHSTRRPAVVRRKERPRHSWLGVSGSNTYGFSFGNHGQVIRKLSQVSMIFQDQR